MGLKSWPVFALLGLVVMLGACGKDGEKSAACAALMCTDRQVCLDSSSPARCVCQDAYTGADCSGCARGYQPTAAGGCMAVPINCQSSPASCGSHGTCVMGAGVAPDLCSCQTGYGGHVCQTCAEGYQDNDRDGRCTASCANMTCTGMMTCSDANGTARCSCPGNRTGAQCDQCPSGWMLRTADNTCVQTCASSATSCGSKKVCDPNQGICVCRPEYAGDLCDSCATGYQDNNSDAICRPSCAMTPCTTGQVCSDTTGTARCACPPNRTGTNCEQCMSGWVLRPSDNTCVQTCAALSCGTHRYCDETSGAPTCVCQAGYTGADCAGCAAGYIADGAGQCVRTAPAGTALLGAGRRDNGEYLLAINPADATATPLRPVANLSTLRLTTNFPARTIYTSTASAISRLDATTGQLIAVATVPSLGSVAFGGDALHAIGPISPYLLKRVNPTSGAVSDIGATNLSGSSGSAGLTWEAGGTLLYARPPTMNTNGAEFVRIDPATATTTVLGALTVDGIRLRPSDARVGVAFDAAGKLYLATRLGRSGEDIVTEHCRKLAAGLGYTDYEAVLPSSVEINYNGIGAGLSRSLTSKSTSGKEIIAYASYGRRTSAKATLRIETTNPDAFVCLSTYEEVLELSITPATARFAAIALTGSRPILTLVVDGTVPPVTRPSLHVHAPSGTVAPAFNGVSGGYQFSRVYSSTEWNALKLPTYVTAWDTDAGAPTVLMEVDLASRTVIRVMSFAGVELFPSIATWAP